MSTKEQKYLEFYNNTKCNKCKEATQTRYGVPVFGWGNFDSKIVFCAREPGADEIKQGIPLVGRAGKIFDSMLANMALSINDERFKRYNVFIINVCCCRFGDNREPTKEEINNCDEIYQMQLNIIKPKILVTCGALSTAKALNVDKIAISDNIGRRFEKNGYIIYPIYHPSYLLYKRGSSQYDNIKDRLLNVFIDIKKELGD